MVSFEYENIIYDIISTIITVNFLTILYFPIIYNVIPLFFL